MGEDHCFSQRKSATISLSFQYWVTLDLQGYSTYKAHALVSNNCIHIQALFIYCCPDCPSCLANVIQTGQATGPIWAWGPSWPTGDDDGVSGTWNVLFMIWRSWVRALVRSNFGCILLLSKSYLNQTHKKEIHPQSYFHQNKVRMFTRTLCARKHTHTL